MITRSRKFKCPPSDLYSPVARALTGRTPTSAERRTLPLPFASPAASNTAVPPRAPRQLGLALPLDTSADQLVMVGCDDDGADPHRVYNPPAVQDLAALAAGKDGAR
jgi:hypothetical protein